MASGSFRFEGFSLDPGDRQLKRDGAPVELNSRYLDALILLVREQGSLISKDRFLDEVWRGVPVTDEALTQCVKTLRRQLGDEAARPRFIETIPKHGYRFIAPVERVDGADDTPSSSRADGPSAIGLRRVLLIGAAGTIGGGVAGMIGGLIYGLCGASQPLQPGMGAASMLLVLLCLCILVGLMGGAGVGFGLAAARGRPWPWTIVGAAAGGLLVGAFVNLLGIDAFTLLIGRSPGDITGALEGLVLGGAVGIGAVLGGRGAGPPALRRSVVAAALTGGAAGMLIPSLGGRLMGGSLDLLARQFPGSRLRLDQIGALFGEDGFGPVSLVATGGLEGALFGGCVVGAMILARRSLDGSD